MRSALLRVTSAARQLHAHDTARLLVSVLVLVGSLTTAIPVAGQDTPPDTLRSYQLETVVVTANRAPQLLASSTASVSVVDGAELRTLPTLSMQDVLKRIPGFSFLSLDGLGFEPQPTVRGFYGGGEAEYVVVLIDGRPVNTMERGLINWNLLTPGELESVEVVRGGASSLYGDAALGAVINLRTRSTARPSTSVDLQGGSYNTLTGNVHHSGQFGRGQRYSIGGSLLRTDGYREHAERTSSTLRASLTALATARHTVSISTLYNRRSVDVPGPLLSSFAEADRAQVSPFHQFDTSESTFNQTGLAWTFLVDPKTTLDVSASGEWRTQEATITVPLAANFADTQDREVESTRSLGTIQITRTSLPLNARLIVGTDASQGTLTSRYYDVLFGSIIDYINRPGIARGILQSDADARRGAFGAYAQLDAEPTERVRLSLGARYDAIHDSFDPASIQDLPPIESTTHRAFSPKIGVNVTYVNSATQQGNFYANASRAFKTPTLDQLYDLRKIPVPFPPFLITLSNPSLNPLRGTSYEMGAYHRASLVPGRWAAEGSVAVYLMNMRDELDFDFATFSYVNRSESKHVGVESGLTLYGPYGLSAFATYTYQGVTLQTGDFTDNYVKAIPRDTYSAGVQLIRETGLTTSLTLQGADRIFIDDANTRTIDGHVTVNGRIAYTYSALTASVSVFNLFDATYISTAFTDPGSQSAELFLFPAAERHVSAGLSLRL